MDDIHGRFNLAGTLATESHLCLTGCDRVAVCAFVANFGFLEDSEEIEPGGTFEAAVDGIYERLATDILQQICGEFEQRRAVRGKPMKPVTGSQTRRCVKTNHGTVSKGLGRGDRPPVPRSRLSPIAM
jgi:hypothetical protein